MNNTSYPLFSDVMADDFKPLADRARPHDLGKFVGQSHLLTKNKPLARAIAGGHLHSMIFWGPPGTGKTTLARMLAHYFDAAWISISAVLSGVKEIRAAISQAKEHQVVGKRTILFVDEVHRFNKSQQDAFLPHIEDGTIVFIGATTENPSFELNNALLSRARVYVLKPLQVSELITILQNALKDFSPDDIKFTDKDLELIAVAADGDARRALNFFEHIIDLADKDSDLATIITDVIKGGSRRFDNKGENFYDQISALHKSVRGSDPDAAVYWLSRMLDGGAEPLYLARRMIRMASEDIGNADPKALELAIAASAAYERLGSPEGELALAQCALYLAAAPKSNAAYKAYKLANNEIRHSGSLEVPMHIRNAPTKLMQELGYGEDYRYAHDEDEAYAAGEVYLPAGLNNDKFYRPVDRGLERKIKQHLARLRQMDKQDET